jgi:polysaccharide biosynthesis protein PslG
LRPSATIRAALVGLALVLLLGGLAAAQVPAGVSSIQPLPAVTDSDDRFGIGNVYPDPHWLTLAQYAGMRWNRWEFRWSSIEPRAGQYDWAGSDRVVEESQAAHLNVQGILISTPRWAEARTASSAVPSGLYEPWDAPTNTWGRFVRAMAERYRGRVQAWEVWNEPDYPRGSFSFWFGSKADYYQLLKVAYKAIRSVDPSAPVLLGGLMYWAEPSYLEDLLSMARQDPDAPANNYFFDAVAWHVYSRPSDVYERVRRSRLLLQTYVGQKAIWVNEGNLPVWSESSLNNYARFPLSGTLDEQAAWVVQWYAYALAAGADHVLMYRMHDSDEPEAWGLARSDGSLRPAYVAYQLAARYLSRTTSGSRATLGDVEQIVFERPGQHIVVVWNRTPRPITASVGAAAASALLVAIDGTTRTITPASGTYQLALAPATANTGGSPDDYIVGGAPYILVEDVAAPTRRYEETDPSLAWSGPWTDEAQPAASGGRARVSAEPGAALSFAFAGPTVTWYTALAPSGGVARLTLDGTPLDEVDLRNSSPVAPAPFTYVDLGDGPHVLTVAVSDGGDAHPVGGYVVVDAFVADRALAAPPLPTLVAATPSAVLVPVAPAPPPPTTTPTPPATRLAAAPASWLPTPLGGAPAAPSPSPIPLPAVLTPASSATPTRPPSPPPTTTATPSGTPTLVAAPSVTAAPAATAAPPTPAFQPQPGVPGVIIVPDPPTPTRVPTVPFPALTSSLPALPAPVVRATPSLPGARPGSGAP